MDQKSLFSTLDVRLKILKPNEDRNIAYFILIPIILKLKEGVPFF